MTKSNLNAAAVRQPVPRDVALKRLAIILGVLAVAVILVVIAALLILNSLNGTRHDSVAVAPGVSVATFATIPGDSAYPIGIARAPDGTLYLSAFGSDVLYKVSTSGELTPWLQSGSGLVAPGALTVAPDGTIYLIDFTTAKPGSSAGTIKTVMPSGKVNLFSNSPQTTQGLSFLSHLAFDASGNLYATFTSSGEIWRFSPNTNGSGASWLKLASVGGNAAQPTGIAFDKIHNALIVSDAASGTIYRIAILANGGADQPLVLYRNADLPTQALTFDDAGDLYLIAWQRDNGQLARLEVDNTFTLLAQGFREPSDVLAIGTALYVVNADLSGLVPLFHAKPPFTVDVVNVPISF
jgi:DNA-binding beta-propeller fold protein YncE